MNHKRGRSRNRRAGCKMCKYWKVNGVPTEHKDGEAWSDHVRRENAKEDACDAGNMSNICPECGKQREM